MITELDNIIIDDLLKPVEGKSPSGEYLRYTDTYDKIKIALTEDNPKLEQGLWQRPLKKADWLKAKEICIKTLKEESKDIQICNWLIVSLVHLHGFAGLSFGLELLYRLTTAFWNTVYPLPVEADLETRLAPFFWLEEKFFIDLRLMPITKPVFPDDVFTLDKWEKETKPSDSHFNMVFERFKETVFFSGEDHFSNIEKEISSAFNSIAKLKDFLLEKDPGAPHFVLLTSTIESIKTITSMALNEINSVKVVSVPAEETPAKEDKPEIKIIPPAGKIPDVNHAYKLLEQIADFLLINEPEKVTGYIIKNVAQFRKIQLK